MQLKNIKNDFPDFYSSMRRFFIDTGVTIWITLIDFKQINADVTLKTIQRRTWLTIL